MAMACVAVAFIFMPCIDTAYIVMALYSYGISAVAGDSVVSANVKALSPRHLPPLNRYDPCSHGPYSYGLYVYDLCSYGL